MPGAAAPLAAWTSETALATGLLFVAACGYLAAVYLVGEADRRGEEKMRTYFTYRAEAAAIVAGAISLKLLLTLKASNPALFAHLTGPALPLVILAGVCGLVVLAMLVIGLTKGLRVVAALGVASVIWGWGVAQYPELLPGTALNLTNAGAPHGTFVALVVLFAGLVVIIGPSLALLYRLQNRRLLEDGDDGSDPEAQRSTGVPGPNGTTNPPSS